MTLRSKLPTVQLELERSPVQGMESYITDHMHTPTQTNTVKYTQAEIS